jgi:hypothetical protein
MLGEGGMKTRKFLKKYRRALAEAGHFARVEMARDQIPDFDEVMLTAKDVSTTMRVVRAIKETSRSAELAYFLAKNQDLIEGLEDLRGSDLAFELGRITGMMDVPKKGRRAA